MGDVEYRLADGCKCPVCHSKNVNGGNREQMADIIQQEVSCDDCGAVWQDIYRLQGFSDLEDADGKLVERGKITFCISDPAMRRIFGRVSEYYESEEIERALQSEDVGDALAKFIITEIRDIAFQFMDTKDPKEHVQRYLEVYETLCRAEDQLNCVCRALGELADAAGREVYDTADWGIPPAEFGGPPTE